MHGMTCTGDLVQVLGEVLGRVDDARQLLRAGVVLAAAAAPCAPASGGRSRTRGGRGRRGPSAWPASVTTRKCQPWRFEPVGDWNAISMQRSTTFGSTGFARSSRLRTERVVVRSSSVLAMSMRPSLHGRASRVDGGLGAGRSLSCARMPAAPVTLEGWYVLHEMWAVDWRAWNELAPAAREAAVREATALLESQARPADGHSAFFSLLTQKGDLCCLHWRRDLEALRREEVALAADAARGVPAAHLLVPLGDRARHVRAGRAGGGDGRAQGHGARRRRLRRGGARRDGAPGEAAALPRGAARAATCRFYPMSKRRGEQVNWFDLPPEERGGAHARPRHDRPEVRRAGDADHLRAPSGSTTGSGA